MAWTYDTELPTDKDKVRLMIGDVIEADKQLSDEELTALQTIHGTVRNTAIAACRALAARYARYADKWVGDLKILASQKHEAYLRMAEELQDAAVSGVTGGTGIFAGAMRISQKESVEADTERVAPFFKRDMMRNTDY